MPGNNRSIGGQDFEQGDPNPGNGHSRNMTCGEEGSGDNNAPIIPQHEQPGGRHKAKTDSNKNSNDNIKDDEDLPNYQHRK